LGTNPTSFSVMGQKEFRQKHLTIKIIVTAGAPVVPKSLTDQLADKGILIIPVGNRDKQVMLRITKKKDELITEEFDNFAFVPLLGKEGWSS
jgi:protein-L-isoaspartate(D-aspartate) O-methyltransferase